MGMLKDWILKILLNYCINGRWVGKANTGDVLEGWKNEIYLWEGCIYCGVYEYVKQLWQCKRLPCWMVRKWHTEYRYRECICEKRFYEGKRFVRLCVNRHKSWNFGEISEYLTFLLLWETVCPACLLTGCPIPLEDHLTFLCFLSCLVYLERYNVFLSLFQLSTVIGELQSYMAGEFSLADAVRELKEVRSQVRIRDSQITQLTALVNTLQININHLIEENGQLRWDLCTVFEIIVN